MMFVYDLRCEYLKNPLGIDCDHPRFFWKLDAKDQRGAYQDSRQILVSKDNLFTRIVWDSGIVPGDDSIQIEYLGQPMESCTRYWWKVRVWDESGKPSGWSEIAWYETGLLGEAWHGKWISSETSDDNPVVPYMTTSFTIDNPVISARIYATARGVYCLWLNGLLVDDRIMAPGWTAYGKRILYQTYDVTQLLQDGENVIGAMVGNGWYRGDLGWNDKDRSHLAPRELLLQMRIQLADGRELIIATNKEWTAVDSPLLMSELYFGELYDARREIIGWCSPGRILDQWRPVIETQTKWQGIIEAQNGQPVRKMIEVSPKALIRTAKGDIILDMGQNMAGFVRFQVTGQRGDRVLLKHFEIFDSQGEIYTQNLRRAKQSIEYILKGDCVETYEPFFSYQGFRYVHIVEWPGEMDLSCFTGYAIFTDMEQTGRFSCNNSMINQLQSNIVWSQRGNFIDLPTDCPQRDERLGWTGDAQVFISTASFNYLTAPFFTKWLADVVLEQAEDGSIPQIVPQIPDVEPRPSAAWGDAATICPWTIYEFYQDKHILSMCYPMMKRWVEYMRSEGDHEFSWSTGNQIGDWLALISDSGPNSEPTLKPLIATAFYAHSTRLVARAAKVLGFFDDAAFYEQLYQNIRQTFRNTFIQMDGHIGNRSQTAQVLALHFDLLDERERFIATDELRTLIEANDGHLTTGFVGTPYLCHVLTTCGLHDLACELVTKTDYPSWLYSITRGATTIWEHWDGLKPDGSFWFANMNSFNHYAYGSIGDWLYRNILGISCNAEDLGIHRVRIQPRPSGSFTEANGSLTTLYGKVSLAWRMTSDSFTIDFTIPTNSSAIVVLPCQNPEDIHENGCPLSKTRGVSAIRRGENNVSFLVGSGTYQMSFARQIAD